MNNSYSVKNYALQFLIATLENTKERFAGESQQTSIWHFLK